MVSLKQYNRVLQFQQIMASPWSPWFISDPLRRHVLGRMRGISDWLLVPLSFARDDHPTNTDLQSRSSSGNGSKIQTHGTFVDHPKKLLDSFWSYQPTELWRDPTFYPQPHWHPPKRTRKAWHLAQHGKSAADALPAGSTECLGELGMSGNVGNVPCCSCSLSRPWFPTSPTLPPTSKLWSRFGVACP